MGGVRAVVLTGAGQKALEPEWTGPTFPPKRVSYYSHVLTYEDPGRSIGPRSQVLWKPVLAAVNRMAC